MYYATEAAYGMTVVNNGHQRDQVRRFVTRSERDAWVAAGNPDFSQPGHRAPLPSYDRRVRARREASVNGYSDFDGESD